MKRLTDRTYRPFESYDILTGLDPERLKLIGAITLAWNDIEGSLNTALCAGSDIPYPLWREFTSRIQGVQNKIDLIKVVIKDYIRFPERYRAPMADALGMIDVYRTYRDAVIHAKIVHPRAATAGSSEKKGRTVEVLVTRDALSALYKHMAHYQDEANYVRMIIHQTAQTTQMAEQAGINDPATQSAIQVVQGYLDQLLDCQSRRKSLPALPEFPELDPLDAELLASALAAQPQPLELDQSPPDKSAGGD